MDQINNIQYYQVRRRLILDILENSDKPLNLSDLKALYKEKNNADMPFSDVGDKSIHEWLMEIENVGSNFVNRERIYFLKKPLDEIEKSAAVMNDNKRKTSSPIVSQYTKRSRSAPDNENSTPQTSKVPTETPRQARSVKFRDQPNAKNNVKARSKSENRPVKTLGAPNIYGCMLIGDDFLLGLAIYKLGFSAVKIASKLQSGFCVSGMTIRDAIKKVAEIEDDHHKTALIYIGSIDIAAGKEMIQMMQDMTDLMRVCADKNIRPVLCTLAAMPNYIYGNRKDTLKAFNTYLRNNPFGIPVIDINKCFTFDNLEEPSPFYFMDRPRYVSGFNKFLSLWSKDGRERVYDMLIKNLGIAIVSTGNITLNYI